MRPLTAAMRSNAARAAAALALLAILVISWPFVRLADNAARDLMLTTISPWVKPPKDIVMVAVTEDTLKGYPYRSPIDRGLLATVISRVLAAGPRAVGIDILFDQPTEPAKDAALRAVLKSASAPVFIATADAANGLTAAQTTYLKRFSAGLGTGAADLIKDRGDGTVRTLSPGQRRDGSWRPSLVAAMAASQGIAVPSEPMPMTYFRSDKGDPFVFPHYPAHTVALLPPAWFKDKYVLIGADLPTSDRHRTPFALVDGPALGTLSGLAINAHALAQLIAGDRLMVLHGLPLMGAIIVLAGLGLSIAFFDTGPLTRVLMAMALLAMLWIANVLLLRHSGLFVPPVATTLAVVVANALASTFVWYRDWQNRQFIENAFSHYVSPAYVKTLIAHHDRLRLGGERREVTYVFTDIAGFTSLAEATDAEALTRLLNDYLTGLCGLFLEHGATIDKLIGDAVVGFFGAPIEQPDHAARAVSLLLAIDRFSQSFRAAQAAKGIELGITRAGAHTGTAIIGNFGGAQFFDYTGLGDTVNVASRLEGANKHFGTRICVSGAVAAAAPEHRFRPIASVVLKGKATPVEVLQPLAPDDPDADLADGYAKAYGALERGEACALASFERLATRRPHDPLVRFHLERLRRGESGTTIVLAEK